MQFDIHVELIIYLTNVKFKTTVSVSPPTLILVGFICIKSGQSEWSESEWSCYLLLYILSWTTHVTRISCFALENFKNP